MPLHIKGHRYLKLAENFVSYNVDSLAECYFNRALGKFRKRVIDQPCHSSFKGISKALAHTSPNSDEKKRVDEIISLFNINAQSKVSIYCALLNLIKSYREEFCH
jgi:hypothetical protein